MVFTPWEHSGIQALLDGNVKSEMNRREISDAIAPKMESMGYMRDGFFYFYKKSHRNSHYYYKRRTVEASGYAYSDFDAGDDIGGDILTIRVEVVVYSSFLSVTNSANTVWRIEYNDPELFDRLKWASEKYNLYDYVSKAEHAP